MDEKEFKSLQRLQEIYFHAQSIAHPLDFAMRQHDLLQALAKHLLEPYYQECEARQKEKEFIESFEKGEKDE